MSAPAYDMEAMIANIKRRCTMPTSQVTFEDSDFAELCDDELKESVVPLLMSCREDYFVDYIDQAAPSDGVISFPDNTVASKVRSIAIVAQSSPLILSNLPRISIDTVTGVGFSATSAACGFYVQGNDLVLYPQGAIPGGTTIRIYYYKRTLVLTAPTNYGRVIAVDTATNTLTLDNLPTDWATGDDLNAVDDLPGFQVTKTCQIVSVSDPSVIVDDATDIEVGHFVSLSGYSAIPQIPIEAHGYLAQLTAAKCLESIGDREGMSAAMAKADKMKDSLLVMLSQRVDGSPKKIISPAFKFGPRGWRY